MAAISRHSPALPEVLAAVPTFTALLAGSGELGRVVAWDDRLAAALTDNGRWAVVLGGV